MEGTSIYKRKTRKLIAKNSIILLVLLAVAVLSIWAWFTQNKKADADGIYAISRAEGVEVSWDDTNYYKDLTALTSADVVEGETGLAKNVGSPAQIKLITGNGTKFFEPYLNRRIGEVLKNSDGSWQGYNITEGTGKYIDIDLYFRGTAAKDIYLAGDSQVSPRSTVERISDYGAFSKDYICSATRVAFLDSTRKNCSFIWAPNADYELKESDAGYTRYTTTATETITTSGGYGGHKGGVVNDGNTYYFWTFDDKLITSYPNTSDDFVAHKFTYDSEIEYFVTDFYMYIPTYSNNPTIPILVNSSANKSDLKSSDSDNIDGAGSKAETRYDLGQHFGITNTTFNVGDVVCSNGMFVTDLSYIPIGSRIHLTLGYDPADNIVTVLKYEVDGNGDSFDIGLEETTVTTTVTYYPLDGDVNCTLVNPDSATAISTGEHYKKAINFKDSSTKLNVLPVSVTLAEQFTVVKTGDGYQATYKFQNNKTGKYLSVSGGTVSFATSGSSFSLYYISGVSGPALKSGDYFVVFKNGNLTAVTGSELDNSQIVTVYTGSSYEMITNNANDSQTYQYYDSDNGLVTLGSSSTPMLFTSKSTDTELTKIGNTKIATLTKENEDDEYYTAHIVMRIWAEGTDRDAKTPLSDGIFDTSFHFISQ